jgi:cation diffusion facilitator CzcD-associated flavoprotein CzcO
MSALDDLEAELAPSLIAAPSREAWQQDGHVFDVVIIGGGQSGLGVAWSLMRDGITNILVADENPPGKEGPWDTFARMPTLRTPKGPTGVDGGLPGLTAQDWFEATYGEQAWADLTFVPTKDWMGYLRWLRKVTGVPVVNHLRLERISPGRPLASLALTMQTPSGERVLLARKLVLATGYLGGGGPNIPAVIADNLPPGSYAHSREQIDFESLRGRVVAVIGAGASAFDNAATAAERGAGVVHHLVRREKMPVVNLVRWMDFAAFGRSFVDLPDRLRVAYVRRFLATPMPPPPDTLLRARALENHVLHLGAPVLAARQAGARVVLTLPQGSSTRELEADFVILGTGFVTDLTRRPELAGVLEHVAFWGDRYTPDGPPDGMDARIASYPYLGREMQFLQKRPGEAPWVEDIVLFCNASTASNGPIGSGVNALKFNVARLVSGLLRDLWVANAA